MVCSHCLLADVQWPDGYLKMVGVTFGHYEYCQKQTDGFTDLLEENEEQEETEQQEQEKRTRKARLGRLVSVEGEVTALKTEVGRMAGDIAAIKQMLVNSGSDDVSPGADT